jgi:hypothetical protein
MDGRVRLVESVRFCLCFWWALERSASTDDCGEITPTPTPPGREGQKKKGDAYPG